MYICLCMRKIICVYYCACIGIFFALPFPDEIQYFSLSAVEYVFEYVYYVRLCHLYLMCMQERFMHLCAYYFYCLYPARNKNREKPEHFPAVSNDTTEGNRM